MLKWIEMRWTQTETIAQPSHASSYWMLARHSTHNTHIELEPDIYSY